MSMKFIDWLTLRDYEAAKAQGVRHIVGRYSRGNVLTQIRRYLSDSEAADIVREGDRALDELERATASR